MVECERIDDSLGAGLQMAIYDVVGKALEVPLYRLLNLPRVREWCPISWWNIDMPPEAFAAESAARICDLVPHVIEVPADVAAGFACNAMPVGDTVISSLAASQLESPLERAGFSTVELPMSEFMKSGGGVRCLSLPLDLGA